MAAPRMTAAERAERGPIPALFGGLSAHPTGRVAIYQSAADLAAEPEPWTIDGWQTNPACAIVGPCLTGAHTMSPAVAAMIAEPEPTDEAPE